MNIHNARNHTFSAVEIMGSGQSIILVDKQRASALMLKRCLGVSLGEINRFLQPETQSALKMIFVHESGIITEIRLLCLLGYSEAKQRESAEA